MTKIYCPICECDTEGSVSVIERDDGQLELYHCDECSENFWRRVERAGGNMTETKAEYITKDITKVVAWHCVTDEHGEGCMARMGTILFDPTRLVLDCDGEIIAIIRGDAEVRCPRCGKPQDWHWEREHPAMKRIEGR